MGIQLGGQQTVQNLSFAFFIKYYLSDEIKEQKPNWACGMYGREEKLESMKEMDHLADLSRCEDNTKFELWETAQDGVE